MMLKGFISLEFYGTCKTLNYLPTYNDIYYRNTLLQQKIKPKIDNHMYFDNLQVITSQKIFLNTKR